MQYLMRGADDGGDALAGELKVQSPETRAITKARRLPQIRGFPGVNSLGSL